MPSTPGEGGIEASTDAYLHAPRRRRSSRNRRTLHGDEGLPSGVSGFNDAGWRPAPRSAGSVRPMTGVTFPASISSVRKTMSFVRSFAWNGSSRWLTNRDTTNALRRAGQASEPVSRPSADEHESSLARQNASQVCQRTVTDEIDDQVVLLLPLGEVVQRVVDDRVSTDRVDELDASACCRRRSRRHPLLLRDAGRRTVPIPPAAPLIRTLCPAWSRPASRRAWRAVQPAIRDRGSLLERGRRRLRREVSSTPHRYSAKAPLRPPNTSSPG